MTEFNNNRLRPGDFVSFKFPYSDGRSRYARPSLVVEATDNEILLAYCTTSPENANVGFELRINSDFEACGLVRQSRVVLARRVRVSRSDCRFVTNGSGTAILGHLTPNLMTRAEILMSRIKNSWGDAKSRVSAERQGIHPSRGRRRRKAGCLFQV